MSGALDGRDVESPDGQPGVEPSGGRGLDGRGGRPEEGTEGRAEHRVRSGVVTLCYARDGGPRCNLITGTCSLRVELIVVRRIRRREPRESDEGRRGE
jgi:hypothetical protein